MSPVNRMVAFYKQHFISPVRQDISNIQAHFERREALFRHLGVLPFFIKGKNVLEVGPGSGFNSLYTSTLEPARYVLVEGNPCGLSDLHCLLHENIENKTIEIIPYFLEEADLREQFDFVFCEGVLGGMGGGADSLFKRLLSLVGKEGLLVVTCTDSVSFLPEILRRLFAQILIHSEAPLQSQVDILLPVFSNHLSTLKGMSRLVDDWITDNLINPASIGSYFSMPDAIELLLDKFEVYASSPHFITDWRWYKSIVGEARLFNERALEQYWENLHSLLDYRYVFPPRAVEKNIALNNICNDIHALVRRFEKEKDSSLVLVIKESLLVLVEMVAEFSPDTALALKEARTLLTWPQQPINTTALAASKNFGSLFGRGQQYLSISRKG